MPSCSVRAQLEQQLTGARAASVWAGGAGAEAEADRAADADCAEASRGGSTRLLSASSTHTARALHGTALPFRFTASRVPGPLRPPKTAAGRHRFLPGPDRGVVGAAAAADGTGSRSGRATCSGCCTASSRGAASRQTASRSPSSTASRRRPPATTSLGARYPCAWASRLLGCGGLRFWVWGVSANAVGGSVMLLA
eukprot:126045-Rhodomonas_salina.4